MTSKGEILGRTGVEAILGPAGDFSTGPLVSDSFTTSGWSSFHPVKESPICGDGGYVWLAMWTSDEVSVIVLFDKDGQPGILTPIRVKRMEQGTFDNLLWRAKRQWHRWFPEE